jgi:hypothetical protein
MKKYIILAIIVMAAGLAFFWWQTRALQINDVAVDPGAHPGRITITGIIGAYSPQDRTLFGLTDTRLVQSGSPSPRKEFIPVRYQGGELPPYGEEVRVTGSFQLANGGYLFMAENIKILNKRKL